MPKWTKLTDGNDSTVYLSEDKILKIYDASLGNMDIPIVSCILSRYISDTNNASRLVDGYRSLRTFRLANKKYDICVSIEPLGEIVSIIPDDVDILPRLGRKEYFAILGQKFISGDNVTKIISDYDRRIFGSVFHDAQNEFESIISTTSSDIEKLVKKEVGTEFDIVPTNIKPKLEDTVLKLQITDLACSILQTYGRYAWRA